VGGIVKYMQGHVSPSWQKPFTFPEKRMLVFPFIHPRHREEVLKRYEGLADIEERFARRMKSGIPDYE
jgi:hypothetical protein